MIYDDANDASGDRHDDGKIFEFLLKMKILLMMIIMIMRMNNDSNSIINN